MATWIDIFSLFVTIGVFGGTIYGVAYAVKQISQSIKSTKENLKTQGYDISHKGVSIKTSKRFDRQDYIDATQRGMLKTMTAASFNRRNDSFDDSNTSSPASSPTPSATTSAFVRPATVERMDSGRSAKSSGSGGAEKKKRGFFGRKNSE